MSDWETYTGGDGNSANFDDDDGWDPDGGNDSDDWNPDEGNDAVDDDWDPDKGNDTNEDDWNPDGGDDLKTEGDDDDWDPDGGGNESPSGENNNESDRPNNNQNNDNDDAGGFWDNYFGDNESSAGAKKEEDADDEIQSELSNNEQKDDGASRQSNDFFAKDDNNNNDGWGDSNNDAGVEDFYNEASKRKQPVPPQSPGSHRSSEVSLSQQSHAFSQHSNISAAELSRMEEDLLSQTSHREDEMKRQSEKQKRRERRRNGETTRRPRKPLSEEQKEYKAAYQRMKYRKKLELSEELDIGGSFAYLSRRKLEEESEQKRLNGLAWERERQQRSEPKKGDDGDEVASSKQGSRSSKSKWSTDGYAALPTSEARDLPFFVYTKRPRSCSNSQMDSDSDNNLGSDDESIGDEDDGNESKKKKSKHQLLIEDNNVEIKGMDVVSKYKPKPKRKMSQQLKSPIVGSFPLHHNRTKSKGGVSNGSEQMVWSQGRNAKRLCARMIASSGVCTRECPSKKDADKNTADAKDDESSSSRSINSSNETQSPVLAATDKRTGVDTNDNLNESNQLLRLTRQIHELPKTTHRHHFVTAVANELGRNRYLWEESLREWVERNDYFSEEKQFAIKYFLGVDGDITSGAYGFIVNTHPTKFVGASRRLRQQLRNRFNRWVQQKRSDPNHKSEGDEATDDTEIFDPMANNSDDTEAGFDADDVNIIFNSNIDVFSIASTLSYFLNKLSLVKKRYDNLQQMNSSSMEIRLAERAIRRWHQIISSFLATVSIESKSTMAAFVKASTTQYQLPLFKAIAAQHSYIANGSCLELFSRKQEEKGESDSDSDVESDEKSHKKISLEDQMKNELLQIDQAGKEIFQSTRGHMNNEGLEVFTSIRLTIGISTITEFLPPSATEIMSRQTYSGLNAEESPFDLIRQMLAHLEERGSLVSVGSLRIDKSERPVVDESLTDAMRIAVRLFRHCKELDPSNVQYWSWYVAATCGRLCIASGTSLLDKTNAIERKRERLPCFSEARAEASCAVDEFIQRAKSEDCSVFFFAVTSMLEWKRAVILLHRHALFSTVNRLHTYATYQWAVKCGSTMSLARVQSLHDNRKIPLDALLDVLARQVEQNASDMNRWSMLVTALGGLGTAAEAKCNTIGECSVGCSALREGLCLNHTIQKERNEDVWWWGEWRASDWESTFFVAPRSCPVTSQDFIHAVLDAHPSARWKNIDLRQVITARTSHQEALLPDDPQDCMDWLFDEDEGDNDIDIDLNHERLLPGKYTSTSSTNLALEDHLDTLSKITNKQMRALCLKVIVACHLLGVWHPFVSNSIWWLSVKAHASNQSACESLYWLATHGLDIQAFVQKREGISTLRSRSFSF